jgi:hypothetical protein
MSMKINGIFCMITLEDNYHFEICTLCLKALILARVLFCAPFFGIVWLRCWQE